jgi:uncharacterized protein (DUF1697 family)
LAAAWLSFFDRRALTERVMATYVALLYSIGLGDGRRLVMADFRAMASKLGLEAPRTLIATGNLIFEAKGTTVRQLEAQLESAFEQTFGRRIDIIVRNAAAWRKLVAGNPFAEESRVDGSRVVARVARRPIGPGVVAALARYQTNGERVEVVNGDLWIHFAHEPNGSRILTALTPARLSGTGTLRNWNTIRRLGDMLAPDQ